jgi:hypothetical protein
MKKTQLIVALAIGLFLGTVLSKQLNKGPEPNESCGCSK